MFRLTVVFLFTIMAFSGSSQAQSQCSALIDQGFACAVPAAEFIPDTTAILSQISGEVRVTSDTQYAPVTSATALDIGDAVVVLESASALLTFGPTCLRPLPAQSSIVIRSTKGCVYPSIVEAQGFASSQNLSVDDECDDNDDNDCKGGGVLGAGVAIGGVVTAAVVALALSEKGDDSVSP